MLSSEPKRTKESTGPKPQKQSTPSAIEVRAPSSIWYFLFLASVFGSVSKALFSSVRPAVSF